MQNPCVRICKWVLFVPIIATALFGFLTYSFAVPPAQQVRPRLAVLVVFDQMRADYLTRWQSLFGDGGIRRLQTEGAWFQNCNYPYADTVTATGHASMLTGCSPDRHGIIGNEWYDREAGAEVSCVASDRYRRVPPAGANATGKKSAKEGASPERLLAPTVGDVLKEATGGRARVVSLSFKDRSAVLPAGRHPDACYWFSGSTAEAITSTYYRDRIHSWVADFNRAHQVDQWFHKEWTRLRPELDYAHFSGPDDVAGEGNGSGQGRTFPHPFGAADKSKPTSSYYGALYNSPFANEVLLNLVERAIDAEHLGTQDTPDLLCVSFSSNDAIGHCYGPDSQEVLDVTLRSDLIVRDLLNYLDAKVGKGCYVLALTADHGVCPLPEVVRAQGKDAGRIIPSAWPKQANAFLKETFARKEDKSNWIEAFSPPWIYLNKQVLRKQGLKEEEVERALANWLVKQPGIQSAYTRTQLLGELPKDDSVGRAVQRSFYPARSGEVAGVMKPYFFMWGTMTGTTHGSPHPYDTHVPLLVYGPGIEGGARDEAVTPQAIAAIFAHSLGIPKPAMAEAPLPATLQMAH